MAAWLIIELSPSLPGALLGYSKWCSDLGPGHSSSACNVHQLEFHVIEKMPNESHVSQSGGCCLAGLSRILGVVGIAVKRPKMPAIQPRPRSTAILPLAAPTPHNVRIT